MFVDHLQSNALMVALKHLHEHQKTSKVKSLISIDRHQAQSNGLQIVLNEMMKCIKALDFKIRIDFSTSNKTSSQASTH